MKKAITLLLIGTMIVTLLAGCQPSQTKSSEITSASTGTSSGSDKSTLKTEINVWAFMDFDTMEAALKSTAIAAFNKEYPNVKVNLEILNGDTGPEKIMVAMGAGSTPDLLLDIAARVLPAMGKNLVVPLTDIRKELSDIVPENNVKCGLINGEYYYLPTTLSGGYHMTVNVGLAKELGVYNLLPVDHETWSYADFLTLCRETVKAGKSKDIKAVTLYAGSRSSDSMYYSLMMCGGADIINADHTAAIANSAAGVKVFDLLKTLVDEGLCLPGPATMKDADIGPYLYSNKVLIVLPGAGYGESLDSLKKIAEGSVAKNFQPEPYMYPTPDGKGTPKVLTFGSSGGVVFKNSGDADKIEAAKRLLKEILINVDYCQIEADLGNVTFGKVNYTYPNDWVKQMADYVHNFDAKYATPSDGVATLEVWWASVREVFYPELQALYTGKKTSQQALDDFVAKANTVITAASK